MSRNHLVFIVKKIYYKFLSLRQLFIDNFKKAGATIWLLTMLCEPYSTPSRA